MAELFGEEAVAHLRQIRLNQITRLREFGVIVRDLPSNAARDVFWKFGSAFVGGDQLLSYWAEVNAAQSTFRELDFDRWLRRDGRPELKVPSIGWVVNRLAGRFLYRLERRVAFGVAHVGVDFFRDEWAFSWPGAYVSFDHKRAITVSNDYEVAWYDMRPTVNSPYR